LKGRPLPLRNPKGQTKKQKTKTTKEQEKGRTRDRPEGTAASAPDVWLVATERAEAENCRVEEKMEWKKRMRMRMRKMSMHLLICHLNRKCWKVLGG
jgi:hypothetical protein